MLCLEPPSSEAVACKRVRHRQDSGQTHARAFALLVHSGVVAAMEAFQLIDALEDQLSVYRTSSEISHLNREANQEWVRIEEGFFDLLVRGSEISNWTWGAFDMTSQPLSDIWGFTDRQGRVPSESEVQAALKNVGHQGVLLNAKTRAVRLEPIGLQVNLGGIGKGYALDRAALKLSTDGIEDFVLHGGQSSVVARGREE